MEAAPSKTGFQAMGRTGGAADSSGGRRLEDHCLSVIAPLSTSEKLELHVVKKDPRNSEYDEKADDCQKRKEAAWDAAPNSQGQELD